MSYETNTLVLHPSISADYPELGNIPDSLDRIRVLAEQLARGGESAHVRTLARCVLALCDELDRRDG